MTFTGRLTGLAVFAALLGVVIATLLVAVAPGPQPFTAIHAAAPGDPGESVGVRLDDLEGPAPQWTHAWLDGEGVVILLKLERSLLEASQAATGHDTLAFATEVPSEPDVVLVAYSAKSTHLGCTVDFRLDLWSHPDGVLMDPCHLSFWDPYDLARVAPGVPAKTDLWAVDLNVHAGGFLWGARTG